MSANLPQLIDAFAGRSVLVLGEAILDSYLEGHTGRFCPEAPAPIVTLAGRKDLPGGAANTAVNAQALGGRVAFLSVTGDDADGGVLRHVLRQRGVSTEHLLVQDGRRTLSKQRVLASGQILLRLDQGSTGPIDEAAEQALLERLASLFPLSDAVILSDYRYGILTPRVLRALADLQARWSKVVVADSRRLEVFRDVGLTAAKPNYDEAVALLGAGTLDSFHVRAEGIARYGEQLLDRTGAQIVAVTLDCEGAVVFERGRAPHRTYAQPARACVAGAGDTFTSALALALAAGAPTSAAAELASAAAAVVVGKERTAACSAQELREYVSAAGKYVGDVRRLATRLDFYREQGRKIVFTNGCFDILHRGHITYLNRAKTLGDVLVVGVNSDESIRRIKGPSRPINTLEDRIGVLAALSCIDHLIAFDEDTPCNLVRALRPHVFVKGGDYTRERLPEAPIVEALGGVVQILPFLEERSTTNIIERIQGVSARPANAI